MFGIKFRGSEGRDNPAVDKEARLKELREQLAQINMVPNHASTSDDELITKIKSEIAELEGK